MRTPVTLDYDDAAVQISLTWAADARANAGDHRLEGNSATTAPGSSSRPRRAVADARRSDKTQYVGWVRGAPRNSPDGSARNYGDDLLRESVNVMKLLDLSYRSGGERKALEFR